MPFIKNLSFALILLAMLQGCAGSVTDAGGDADAIAASAALRREDMPSGIYTLTTYARIRAANQPVTIYIAGDMPGWMPPVEPGGVALSDDLLALRLAALDPAANVVYIAHPCQFPTGDPACDPGARGLFAQQAMIAINRAVDHFVVSLSPPQINLVGVSGGAAIAALLAARRHDVVSLRTIAGNLDPAGAARYHAADLDEDFIDPLPIAPRLALLPQQHYVGSLDSVTPPFLGANFIKATGATACAHLIEVAGATHDMGWEQLWKNRVMSLPTCGVD